MPEVDHRPPSEHSWPSTASLERNLIVGRRGAGGINSQLAAATICKQVAEHSHIHKGIASSRYPVNR